MANDVTGLMGLKVPGPVARLVSDTALHTYVGANTHAGNETFSGTLALGAGALLDLDTSTAAAVSDAVTINKMAGVIGTTALTDGATVQHTITLTNSTIAAVDLVNAWVQAGTNTTGFPVVGEIAPAAGTCTIKFINAGTAAFNGTIKLAFVVFKG